MGKNVYPPKGTDEYEELLRKQRERRAASENSATKKYERTKNGKLMRTYRNMLSRVSGIQKKKAHLYEGNEIISKEDFYRWALSCRDFHAIYDAWVASGYTMRNSPSIDRIDPSMGYIIGNMQWLTHSENSAKIKGRKPKPR